jgi:hypothetical protein
MENESLILDLLEWVASTPKSYEDVMNAWRTSCPRLTIWEDALDAKYLKVRDQEVRITTRGLEFLRARRNKALVNRDSFSPA